MLKIISRKLHGIVLLLALALVGLSYLRCLPFTVQYGDTGELVADAYLYQIPHPSGYPLFINLYFSFLHAWPWGSVFFKGALLTSLLSLGTLALISLPMVGTKQTMTRYFAIAVSLCLGFSKIFWRYSVLPDVFALQSLLIAGILWFYINEKKNSALWATLIFSLGLANHLTILALTPVLMHLWLRSWKRDKRMMRVSFIRTCLAGFAFLMILYASLLEMHPESFYSWGRIQGVSDVLKHFLREDYGRTREPLATWLEFLPIRDANASDPAQPGTQFAQELQTGARLILEPSAREFLFYGENFLRQTAFDLGSVLVFIIAMLLLAGAQPKAQRDIRTWVLLGITLVYCYGIFSLLKINPQPDSLIVVERFFILPQLVLCFTAILIFRSAEENLPQLKRLIQCFLFFPLLSGFFEMNRYAQALNYSDNTIVEDYAFNWLRTIPAQEHALVLTQNDTQYFSLRYVQQIFGRNPEARVLSPQLLFHPWYAEKLQLSDPTFVFDTQKISRSLQMNLKTDFFEPNQKNHFIYSSRIYGNEDQYHLIWSVLGRRLTEGQGSEFSTLTESSSEPLLLRSGLEAIRTPDQEYDPARSVYSEYSDPILARGVALMKSHDLPRAEEAFLAALERVPYCIPALKNYCLLKTLEVQKNEVKTDTLPCATALKWIESSQLNYY